MKIFNPTDKSVVCVLQHRLDARVRRAVQDWLAAGGHTRPLPTVEGIAADIGIPPDQLSVYVRVHHDDTILGWRKGLRIAEAKRLLTDLPNVPVAEIGRMVGIVDKSNCRRQFTETVRCTPREWRGKHRK